MIQLDCQGLPCPQPVLKCKQLIEEQNPQEFSVVVDNEAARENVTRFISLKGYEVVETKEENGKFILLARLKGSDSCPACENILQGEASKTSTKTLVFINSEYIGRGDDELGKKLMQNFLATLPEIENLWRIILVNGGVKMATSNHPSLTYLQQMEENGISILVCGTCLDFFQLLSEKEVGQTTNMLDVVTSLQLADKIIAPC